MIERRPPSVVSTEAVEIAGGRGVPIVPRTCALMGINAWGMAIALRQTPAPEPDSGPAARVHDKLRIPRNGASC